MAEEMERLYRIRRTSMQMLRDRGYVVADSDVDQTNDEFRARFGNEPDRDALSFTKAKGESEVYVHFANDVNKAAMNSVRELLELANIDHVILVSRKPVPKASMEVLAPLKVETFLDSELFLNVTQHELVPQHRVLTSSEKDEVLKQYTAQDGQLPRMLESDPVARYYGLKKGQLVKVTRRGGDVTYRCIA